MIVYDREKMAPSKEGIYPNLESLYNTVILDTREHMERVGRYSAAFYHRLWERIPDRMKCFFDVDFTQECERLFCLHDLGRVYIPNEILNKIGQLTEEERVIIQNHTIYAKKAVKAVYHFPYEGKLLNHFYDIALYHHERYDGKGYPEGRAAEDIPLSAQICALADVFDGITSWKPYKTRQTTRKQAGEIILSEAGKQFDPLLAEIFVEEIPELPNE